MLEQWITRLWYGKPSLFDRLLALPLLALAPLTRLASARRTYRRTTSSEPTVIVVGNLTAGGTGKTPIVVELVHLLKARGYRVGVVMRGYRTAAPVGDPSIASLGDEARMIITMTGAPLVCNPDRLQALRDLTSAHELDAVISDDGLQHAALPRDYEIVVIDGARGFGNTHLLPYGPLREPLKRANSVNAFITNGELIPALPFQVSSSQLLTHSQVESTGFRNIASGELLTVQSGVERLSAMRRLIAIAGIGNPDRFFTQLQSMGLNFEKRVFADHHAYRSDELALESYDGVITTAKDAQNLPRDFADKRFWVLEIAAQIDQRIVDNIAALIRTKQSKDALHGKD
jgi:tetraacyldisaccharide 4'-kinase